MDLYTIGFAGKSAEEFFGLLSEARIERLVDVRLRTDSQLAGFTKRRDLPFFLEKIAGISYEHQLTLAPTDELLNAYRKKEIDWEEYAKGIGALIVERDVSTKLERSDFEVRTVLLCSEAEPDECHRRIAAEYLAEMWPEVDVHHL